MSEPTFTMVSIERREGVVTVLEDFEGVTRVIIDDAGRILLLKPSADGPLEVGGPGMKQRGLE